MTAGISLARKTMVGTSWLVLWRFVTRLLGFGSTLILARLLVPEDFGLVAMANTFAIAIESLSELGIQSALVRHPAMDRSLFDTGFTLQVARAAVTAAVVAISAPFAAAWFNEPRLAILLLALAGASLIAGFENPGIVEFRREMRFDVQFRMLAIPRLAQLAVTIPLALATGSYWALTLGTVMSRLARTVLTYLFHPYRPRFALTGWRELASFSLWAWATSITIMVWERSDPFVLGPVIGSGQLGAYLLAIEMAIIPISELVAPASEALFAAFVASRRTTGGSAVLALQVAGALVLVTLPVTAAISCASGYVVAALLGPRWIEAGPLIAVLSWMCVFSPFSYVASARLIADGLVRRDFIAHAAVAAGRLGLLSAVVAFTTRLDLVAIAVVACLAFEAVVFVLLLTGLRSAGLGGAAGSLLRGALAVAAVLFVLRQAGLAWQPVAAMASIPALLTCALTGMVALAVFWPVVLLLWLACGRPAGPEALLLDFARSQFGPLLAKR